MMYLAAILTWVISAKVYAYAKRKSEWEIKSGGLGNLLTRAAKTVDKILFYDLPIGIFIFGFMEFVIAGYYGFQYTSSAEWSSNMFTYISIVVVLVAIPLIYYWVS